MPGNKLGFTFLELVIAISIIGIIAAIVVPNFRGRLPGYQRKEFINRINTLVQVAWQNAVSTHKLHRIIFDLTKRTVSVESSTDKKSATNEIIFQSIKNRFLNTVYEWPVDNFEFKNFYIKNNDEMKLTLKGGKGKVWFFITPEGLAQSVIINLLDIKAATPGIEFSLVLNPFWAQFNEYETFQRPA